MRKETITCDGCGKDITTADSCIMGHNISMTIKEEGVKVYVSSPLCIDTCSWECWSSVLREQAYKLATDVLNERKSSQRAY